MVTHFSIFAWKIVWTEKHGGLQSVGSQKLDTTEDSERHSPEEEKVPILWAHDRISIL